MKKCNQKCEVYSRVVGYYRPVSDWNVGKREEFHDRLTYIPCPDGCDDHKDAAPVESPADIFSAESRAV